jgi:exopolysaccharide biosynthesis polyprenyl glycosylphosphotransferase
VHNGFPLLSAKNEKITRIRYKLLKRCFDIVFSLLVIVFILSWLYPLIALLIKLESRGPVLFLQKRIGYQNNPFICFKFRSMVVHTETGDVMQASKNDPRLTKIGAFIRRHNIDEMPQFFNVLLGNMSVVGPRPHAVPHDIQYKNTMEDYILRHYAKPGITGWAQVNGWRGPTDTRQKIVGRAEHDIWYIRNWSFLLDLEIILKTIISKQSKLNAY